MEITNIDFVKNYLEFWLKAAKNKKIRENWYEPREWTKGHMKFVLYPLAWQLISHEIKSRYKNDTRKKVHFKCNDCNRCMQIHLEKCILNDSDSLNFACNAYAHNFQQEYYKVDFTIFDYEDYGEETNENWTLAYAIEHENCKLTLNDNNTIKYYGWFSEFKKLLPIKCANARVIISYDDFDGENGNIKDEKLNMCLNLLNNSFVQNSLTDTPIILILFPSTSAIKNIVENNEYPVIQIFEFEKKENEWETSDLSKSDIVDKGKFQEVYKKIKNKQ